MFNETRSILEPAGAVALAGAKAFLQVRGWLRGWLTPRRAMGRQLGRGGLGALPAGRRLSARHAPHSPAPHPPTLPAPRALPTLPQYNNLSGKRVVAVTSGANMNFDRLRLVSGAWS